MTPRVRWALMGYGSGGRVFHAPLIISAAGMELVAVVTGNAERRRQVTDQLPGVIPVNDLRQLADLGVRGVTITTPPATHAELAHRAIDLGLAVVVDKPFALTAKDAREIVSHADRAGVPLSVYQNRRWDSDLLTVKALVDNGTLGTVHRFTSRIDRFRPVKPGWTGGTVAEGAGTLLDLGPHLIDQALHLFGPAHSVHAELLTLRPDAQAEDDIQVYLTHRQGVRSTLTAGMASAAPGPRFQVNGSTGGFIIDGFDVQEQQLKDGGSPAALGEKWGVEPESAWGRLFTVDAVRPVESARGRWDTFYPSVAAALASGDPMPVDAADAVHTAAVIDAARVAADTGRVVTL